MSKKIPPKHRAEIKARQDLKRLLLNEQMESDDFTYCSTCGRQSPCIGAGDLELAHIIALSRGGKTEYNNCVIEGGNFLCGCSARYEKKPEDRPNQSPGYKKWERMTS